MSLNIKNPRVHELAKQAARVTGRTQTGAIEEALERLLADYGADPVAAAARHKFDVVHGIVAAYQAQGRAVGPETRPEILTVEDLYDERTGLPA